MDQLVPIHSIWRCAVSLPLLHNFNYNINIYILWQYFVQHCMANCHVCYTTSIITIFDCANSVKQMVYNHPVQNKCYTYALQSQKATLTDAQDAGYTRLTQTKVTAKILVSLGLHQCQPFPLFLQTKGSTILPCNYEDKQQTELLQ